jgi:uncharacterized integral membrane protein
MKSISSLVTLLVIVIALCFALNNRQSATVSLWPFGIEMVAPLYLLSLGTLLVGILLGVTFGWALHVPHRAEARRLRRDIAGLRDKIEDMRHAAGPRGDENRALLARLRTRHRFWSKRP